MCCLLVVFVLNIDVCCCSVVCWILIVVVAPVVLVAVVNMYFLGVVAVLVYYYYCGTACMSVALWRCCHLYAHCFDIVALLLLFIDVPCLFFLFVWRLCLFYILILALLRRVYYFYFCGVVAVLILLPWHCCAVLLFVCFVASLPSLYFMLTQCARVYSFCFCGVVAVLYSCCGIVSVFVITVTMCYIVVVVVIDDDVFTWCRFFCRFDDGCAVVVLHYRRVFPF